MFSQQFIALGYQQITSLSSSTGLTVPTGANFAIITAEAADVRWRDDGTAPTASVGMTQTSTNPPLHYSGPLAAIKFIAVSGSPVLNVSYYKVAG